MGNTGSASELGVATHGATLVDCVWEIKHGTKDKTRPVTLWRCTKTGKSESHVAQARRAMHALKTTRHPMLLSLVEGIETDAAIVMVTERATPLHLWVAGGGGSEAAAGAAASADGGAAAAPEAWRDEGYRLWGIRCLLMALEFLHESSKIVHGALGPRAVLVTADGSWKLGGLELSGRVAAPTDPLPDTMATANIGTQPLRLDGAGGVFASPEQASGDRASLRGLPPWAIDAWGLAALLATTAAPQPPATWSSPAGSFLPTSVSGRAQLLQTAAAAGLSAPFQALVRKLASAQARARPRPSRAAAALKSVFARHPIVGVLAFLQELPLKSPEEKRAFFAALPSRLTALPGSVRTQMVLPSLMQALEFGAAGGGGTVVLAPLLEIGRELPDDEYKSRVVPCVVRLYGSPDRATRMQLLTHLGAYISHLDGATVNSAVWPRVLEGLGDSSPPLRQATLKAIEGFCPHLTADNLCGSLVKALRRVQSVDQAPALRVNASICMGRTAQFLPASKRVPVLLPPLLAALQDGFAPARAAALKAIAHVLQVVAKSSRGGGEPEAGVRKACAEAVARHVTPTAASSCLDSDGKVRAAAVSLLQRCRVLLEAQAAEMDTAQAAAEAEAETASKAEGPTGASANGAAPAPAPEPAPAPASNPAANRPGLSSRRPSAAPAATETAAETAVASIASGWDDDAFDEDGDGAWGAEAVAAGPPATSRVAEKPRGLAAVERTGSDDAAERRRKAEERRVAARKRLEERRRTRQRAAAAAEGRATQPAAPATSAAASAPAPAANRANASHSLPASGALASTGAAAKPASGAVGWGDDDEDWEDF